MTLDRGQLNDMLRDLKWGNPRALDGIYLTVGGRMFALARGIVHNREDAEDVVQESLLKIARSAEKFKEGTNGYAWCMKIVRNTALDFLRKRRIRAEEDIDEFFHLTDESYAPDKLDGALALEEAVAKLPSEGKKMIYYRYYLDLTVREIAKETGMSKSAVQRAVADAEEKLKLLLQAGQNAT